MVSAPCRPDKFSNILNVMKFLNYFTSIYSLYAYSIVTWALGHEQFKLRKNENMTKYIKYSYHSFNITLLLGNSDGKNIITKNEFSKLKVTYV